MVRTIDGPRTIEYGGHEVTVTVEYTAGLYAGDSGYKEVVAVVEGVSGEPTGTCGTNVFPLRLATWLACRRAVSAVGEEDTPSRFGRALAKLDESTS